MVAAQIRPKEDCYGIRMNAITLDRAGTTGVILTVCLCGRGVGEERGELDGC